jgi:hypothetical protein
MGSNARDGSGRSPNKRQRAAQTSTEDSQPPQVSQHESETPADVLARNMLKPSVQAALTVKDYNKSLGEMSINTLVFALSDQCEAASSGDLKRGEALLTAQAHTLDAIFNNLARKAARCEYLNQAEVNLRLALKAQSQCRATLETLAAIKNPQPVAFVQQANIAHGPQQVNNEAAQPSRASHAREREKQPNKLLETPNEKPLDTGAQGATGYSNPALETVGAIDRSKDRRG